MGGETAEHFLVYDGWRRLLFVGAGELEKEWLVGLLAIEYADTVGMKLDDRMRDELRVLRLNGVRVLKERAPEVQRSQRRPSSHQRKKRKREEVQGVPR